MNSDIIEAIKNGYQLKIEKNRINCISTTLNSNYRTILLAPVETSLPYNIVNSICRDDVLLMNYYEESATFSTVLKKRDSDSKTLLCTNGHSYYESLSRISEWLSYDYKKILEIITTNLDTCKKLIFMGEAVGYLKKNKILKLSSEELTYLKMFSRISFKLKQEKTIAMEVTKNKEKYLIKLNDYNQNAKILINSSDLLDGLLAVDRNISNEKGKILNKRFS